MSLLVRLAAPSVVEQMDSWDTAGGEDLTTLAGHRAAEVARADLATAQAQVPVVAAIEALGARVVGRYSVLANGLLVHASSDQARHLISVPGVVDLEPAPQVRPRLRQSVPYVGAPQLAAVAGYDGRGTVIAVIDTGIDYTHASFGGPGTVEAYLAAAARAETIDDTWQGLALFPTAKVVGGWDFVGPNYSSPSACRPELEAARRCTTIPRPDPDPLDQHGHGTHVAGIAAGMAVAGGAVASGVAPAAELVALKIYGPPQPGVYVDEAADVLVDALEWCGRVNLGLPVPGIAPPRIDVVNMSLGEDYGQGSRLYDEVITRLTDLGIVVVAAAGNSGDVPYIVNAPGASPAALAVANVLPPGTGIMVPAAWETGTTTFLAVEARGTPVLQLRAPISGELAAAGDGCGELDSAALRGQVAWFEPGGCTEAVKITAAEAAGAMAALVVSGGSAWSIQGPGEGGIPAFSVASEAGALLGPLLAAGVVVHVVLDAGSDVAAGSLVAGSARGPSRHGSLKPDIAAPGAGILAAGRGLGTGANSLGGTSMASPHVAGAAALLAQRNHSEGLGLHALDLAALLMNHTGPVWLGAPGSVAAPVVRQGAGRLDVATAGLASLVVRAGDIAALNFGLVTPREVTHYRDLIRVRNLSPQPVQLRPAVHFRRADQDSPGVELRLADSVYVPARGMVDVPVELTVDPTRLRAWDQRGLSSVSAAAQNSWEVDGSLTLVPMDESGGPRRDLAAPRIPFYVLARPAASVWASTVRGRAGSVDRLRLSNIAAVDAAPGRAELFALPQGAEEADPDDAHGELDLWRVGARFEPPTADDAWHLTVGLALRRPAVLPALTRFELFLDTDADGVIDWRARSLPESELPEGGRPDRLVLALGRWDASAGRQLGPERRVAHLVAEMHSRIVLISLPLPEIGLLAPRPVSFYVLHHGLTEDWLVTTAVDVVPDGADRPGGPRLLLRPETVRADPASVELASGGLVEVALHGLGSGGILALYPDNPLDPMGAQVQWIGAGHATAVPPWGPRQVYLPLSLRR